MYTNRKNIIKKIVPDIVFFVFILLFHVLGYECFGDDIGVRAQLQTNVIDQIKTWDSVCTGWSSRTLINPLIHIIMHFDYKVWMIIDVIAWMIIFEMTFHLVFHENKNQDTKLFFLCAMLFFPFEITVSVGWITCSVTYVWTAAAAVCSLVIIQKLYYEKKVKWFEVLFAFLCTIFAANEEELSVILTIIFLAALVILKHENKKISVVLILFAVNVINVLSHLFSANNAIRSASQIIDDSSVNKFGILYNIFIGLYATLKRLFFDNNYCVLILFVLTAICALKKRKYKVVNNVLIIMILVLILGSFLNDNKTIVIISGLVVLLNLFILLFEIFGNRLTLIAVSIALFASGCGRIVVGFANSPLGDYDRTYTYIYLCVFAVVSLLLKELIAHIADSKRKVIEYAILISLFVGFARTIIALGIV